MNSNGSAPGDERPLTMTALAAIVAAGAVLRFWALDGGIPYNIGIDEPQVMNRAVTMMRTGDFNPHFYDYPGLYIYVQVVVSCLRFMAGAALGEWRSLAEPELGDFLLWGRAVTAALGTATVALVYCIAERWGRRQALLAAGLMAVMPLHVRESHFVLTDVPVTFFVALAMLVTLRAAERPSPRTFAWAGAAAGLAAGTKYPGGLAVILPLLAIATTPELRGARGRSFAAVVASAAAVFLLVAPYTLLDLPGFLNGYAKLMASYTGPTTGDPGWQVYLKHLRLNIGWPAYAATVVGCLIALVRTVQGPARLRWMLLVVFPLLYVWFISRQTLIFGRYLLPAVPFVCVLAAAAVVAAAGWLRRVAVPRAARTAAVLALTVVVVVPPAISAVRFNVNFARPGTPGLAHDWIVENIPEGTSIVYEGSDLSLAHTSYDSHHVGQLRHRPYEYYLERGVEYLIASSQRYGEYLEAAKREPGADGGYLRLFELTEEVARFTPDRENPGPELRILKIRR
ncbi:MAG TPA: glycosyltransferase family 39 protein [Vicinamibacterales bacterium]|nr:glycosyltransferase family 39 protein [Vicinamibacterales bacterium]